MIIDDTITVLIGNLDQLENKFQKLTYFFNTRNTKEYSKIDYIDCRIQKKLLVNYGN